VSFGNHEADLPLAVQLQRLRESSFQWLNSNMPTYPGMEKVPPNKDNQKPLATMSSTDDTTLNLVWYALIFQECPGQCQISVIFFFFVISCID
jgi:hypothetical protein